MSAVKKIDVPQHLFDAFGKSARGKQAFRDAKRDLDNTPRHLLDRGNPNHPDNFHTKLFGYEESEFLAKQYK